MKKGVTVAQVAQVADGFTQAGILVHAYLMYGFPTETEQETIDALEMVRQLFEQGVIQSGFWHLFAMTAHSPVGLNPSQFEVVRTGPKFAGFAENDLFHDDPKGADHEQFSAGLRKSLFNFMHGVGLDFPLKEWFEFKTPKTTISPRFIATSLEAREEKIKPNQCMVWLGNMPQFEVIGEINNEVAAFEFFDKKMDWVLHCNVEVGIWLMDIFSQWLITAPKALLLSEFKEAYEQKFSLQFDDFFKSELIIRLRENGLLIL